MEKIENRIDINKIINEILDIENIKNEEIKALFIEANNFMNCINV